MLKRRTGLSILHTFWIMFLTLAVCTLAVDYGRVQVAKQQLHGVAMAAARAGAAELEVTGASGARSAAKNLASISNVDGRGLILMDADVTCGTWDTALRKQVSASGAPDSVRIVARLSESRNTGIPLLWASIFGKSQIDLITVTTAQIERIGAINTSANSPGTANPFLAGMPAGAIASVSNPHNSPDYSGDALNPRQSPMAIPNLPLVSGDAITFDDNSVTGTVRHDPNLPYFGPDGELSDINHNTAGSENGIADVTCPINALVGVFLDDSAPNLTPVPLINQADCPNNYSSSEARNRSVYKPALKQIFFIGDAKTDDGQMQSWVVPSGATRLYIATWDFYEWNNNAGSRTVKITRLGKLNIRTVE